LTKNYSAVNRAIKPPKRQQIAEFYGKLGDNHEFFNYTYKNLLINIKQNDFAYANSENLEERMKFCKNEINTWHNFVTEESKNIPEEDSKISSVNYRLLKEVFERQKVKIKIFLNLSIKNFLKIFYFF